MKKEVFPYPVEKGAVMDYVEDRFLLVIKEDAWSEEEIGLLKQPIQCHLCYTADIFIVVIEGGSIDSCDFYFNVQECDWKDDLLKAGCLQLELVLLDADNAICLKKTKTLNREESQTVIDHLSKQAQIPFQPGEYDVNVEGIQSAYEPYELTRFSLVGTKL